ncbi:MAG: hypothetical protein ACREGC_01855, partial [Minisyncoccia bacterium]
MVRCNNLLLFILLGSTLMLAQACDQSSKTDPNPAKKDHHEAIDVDIDVKQDELPAPIMGDDEPVMGGLPAEPGLIPPVIGPGDDIPGNGPGYGGGSQGFLPPL